MMMMTMTMMMMLTTVNSDDTENDIRTEMYESKQWSVSSADVEKKKTVVSTHTHRLHNETSFPC